LELGCWKKDLYKEIFALSIKYNKDCKSDEIESMPKYLTVFTAPHCGLHFSLVYFPAPNHKWTYQIFERLSAKNLK
jgi:hypothetical protein